jgi:hypothetical protein
VPRHSDAPLITLDLGQGKLWGYGPDGAISFPAGNAEKVLGQVQHCLKRADVAWEAPSVRSSGIETEKLPGIISSSGHDLYVMSARIIKNDAKDRAASDLLEISRLELDDEEEEEERIQAVMKKYRLDDQGCAQRLWEIGMKNPDALSLWTPREWKKLEHKSVRPWDKRDYAGEKPDEWMSRLPDFEFLNPTQRMMLGKKKEKNSGMATEYSRSRAMPFGMAFTEEGARTRDGFERIIGLWSNGYACFYRRNVEDCRQEVAKWQTGYSRNGEVSWRERKKSWRTVRPAIRYLYYMMNHLEDHTQPTLF